MADANTSPPQWEDSRVGAALWAVVYLAAAVVSYLIFATVTSFYPGTGVYRPSTTERQVTAVVEHCEHKGPVSVDGFGYWWQCSIRGTVEGGRTVHATVTRSILGPADVGRQVHLREACGASPGSGCRYGRAVSPIWGALVKAVWIISTVPTLGLLAISAIAVRRAVGPRR